MRERVAEAPAARLAVRVLELDAVDDRVGRHWELRGRLHEVPLQRGGGGDDLEGGPRRLRRGERDARKGAHLGRPRVEGRDATEAAGQAHHGGLLEDGVDRGPERRRGPCLGACEHAVVRDQLAAGPPAQPLLEDLLEPGLPDGPVRREAARVELPALGRRLLRRHLARDRIGDAGQRGRPRGSRPACQYLAVARTDGRAPGRDDSSGVAARPGGARGTRARAASRPAPPRPGCGGRRGGRRRRASSERPGR